MTDKQPEALRLAEAFSGLRRFSPEHFALLEKAAAELRRLHTLNAELVESLQQIIDLPEDSRIHYKVARKALVKIQGDSK